MYKEEDSGVESVMSKEEDSGVYIQNLESDYMKIQCCSTTRDDFQGCIEDIRT